MSPGISFGIGIPISSSEIIGGMGFFAGPTLALGKSQSLQISTGVMMNKVQKLSKGLKVGDVLKIGTGDIPKHFEYALGYFFGLSISL